MVFLQIVSWVNSLATKYPNRAKVYNLGETYEGRQMVALRVQLFLLLEIVIHLISDY